VAVVALSLSAGGTAVADPESSSGAALLPRDVILPLSTVKEVLPEMTQEISTGQNQTVVGNPTANRAVTYATADDSQRVVISVDKYKSSEEASSSYQEASQKSKEVPGVSGSETVSNLGDGAFIGVVTQGDETHVGGGALYGDLIVTATLQDYDGTDENKAKVIELLRKQADAAQISMPTTGGPSLLLPAGALLLGSAILGWTVLRRRS
jgi:hypothetical protein